MSYKSELPESGSYSKTKHFEFDLGNSLYLEGTAYVTVYSFVDENPGGGWRVTFDENHVTVEILDLTLYRLDDGKGQISEVYEDVINDTEFERLFTEKVVNEVCENWECPG